MSQREAERTRHYSRHASPEVRRALHELVLQVSASRYGRALTTLGQKLGQVTRSRLAPVSSFAVVTTPEDADFLTRGMLKSLPENGAHLVCYWTTRFQDVATVHKEYVDPFMPRKLDAVVVAKSIISSGCIVRTNLEEFLGQRRPERILIAAPVMLKGADDQLRKAFSKAIAKRLEFIHFATDTVKDGPVVRPGVGGMVEKRLGLSGKHAPSLVKEWRAQVSGPLA